MSCSITKTSARRLSVLFIILISGFKLGMAAPADGIKGEKREVHEVKEKKFCVAR